MMYSRWKADGGYEYFASPERHALGADLPVPRMNQVSPIGVASTDIGRPLPAGVRPAGSGELARGQIIGMTRAGVLGTVGSTGFSDFGLLVLAGVFGWWLHGALAKEYRSQV